MTHFRLVYSIIWTCTLIYSTNGAPTAEKSMLDVFLEGFEKCNVLDSVVLPVFKSDNNALDNRDSTYDLSVPLEICTVSTGKDNTAVPMCNEAFEVIRNLSTCREDYETLKKLLPDFKPPSIAVKVDNVCEDFSQNPSILAGKKNSVAFKLVDKDICPMVCKGNFSISKACAFLLWGYKVQAQINDVLHQSASSQGVSDVQKVEFVHQNEEHNANFAGVSQEKQSVDVLAGKTQKPAESGEHEIKSSVDNYNLSEFKPKEMEMPKNKVKEPDISQSKPGESESPKPKLEKVVPTKAKSEELVPPNVKSEGLVLPPKVQPSEQKSVIRIGVTSTTVAGKSPTVLIETTKNGKAQYVHNGHSEVVSNAKITTEATTANGEQPHKASLEDETAKLHSDKVNKETGDRLSDSTGNAVGKESKDETASHPASAVPEKPDAERPLPDTSKTPTEDQEYTEEEVPLGSNIHDSAKNENQNVDDPPSDTESNSKPDISMKPTSGKQQSPEDSAHEKTAGTTVTKVTDPSSEDSVSEAALDTSDVMEGKSQPLDEDDEQFDVESNDKNYVDMNENAFADLKNEANVASDTAKPGQQMSLDANKTPAKTIEKINVNFPEQEDTHFFFYFVTIVIFAIGGYVLFHNKQKIFALIIEGRHERRRRSGASYRKLETK